MSIYDELKTLIKEELRGKFSIDRNGIYYSECYKDYRDDLDAGTVAEILKGSDPMSRFESELQESYQESMWEIENDVFKTISESSVIVEFINKNVIDEDVLRDCLRDVWYVNPPYDDFLKQEVCMDIMLDTGDANYEFTVNNLTSKDITSVEDFDDNSSLLWLCEQQGVTREELLVAFDKGNAHSDEVKDLKAEEKELVDKLKEFGFKTPLFNESVIHTGAYWHFKNLSNDLQSNEDKLSKLTAQYKKNDITYDEYLTYHHNKYDMVNPLSEENFFVKKSEILEKLGSSISEVKGKIAILREKLDNSPDYLAIKSIQDKLFDVRRQLKALAKTDDYQKAEFINSVHNEINNTYGSSVVTFLVKMPLEKAIHLQEVICNESTLNNSYQYEERKGLSSITIDKNVRCGLMDDCSGGGSVFEIKLLKDVEIPIKALYRAVPDKENGNYGFMEIYGTNDESFTESLKEIHEAYKSKVSDLIANASARVEDGSDKTVVKDSYELE